MVEEKLIQNGTTRHHGVERRPPKRQQSIRRRTATRPDRTQGSGQEAPQCQDLASNEQDDPRPPTDAPLALQTNDDDQNQTKKITIEQGAAHHQQQQQSSAPTSNNNATNSMPTGTHHQDAIDQVFEEEADTPPRERSKKPRTLRPLKEDAVVIPSHDPNVTFSFTFLH
jgi:hypothetical protein